jgi:tetratricopeptide (TPR) repeat protein
MPLLILCLFIGRPVAAEEAAIGLTPEQIKEIEVKLEPVFKGNPVTEIPEEDRPLLFLAEGLFPESYELFFRHGEYLAIEKHSFTEAIPRLTKALDLKPKDLASLEVLALCHTELKQASEEVSCWETLRELIEEDDTEETRDLRERVTLNLGRMAKENEMIMRQGRRFIIYTPISSEYIHIQSELSDERLEEIYLQVTGDLDCIPAFRTSIIVLDPIKFNEVKPTSWAGGFAQGGKSMTLKTESFPLSESATRLPARSILLHEFTHNIVFIAGAGRCPTWLNEGLAVFAEYKDDTFTEFKPQIPAPEQLMTLDQLEKEFADIRNLDGGPRVNQAYQLAGLYARFIIQNFTMTAPRLILNSLKNKETVESALLDVCKLQVPQFEKRFRNWISEMTNR